MSPNSGGAAMGKKTLKPRQKKEQTISRALIPNAAARPEEEKEESGNPASAASHSPDSPLSLSPIDRAIRLKAESAPSGTPALHSPPIPEPCGSCGVKCCNRFAVPITGFDILRILEKLGGEPTEFCELADARTIEGSPHSRVFIFDKGVMGERLLVLKRHPKTNWCHFSRHSMGCAIWGYHPLVCRSYPFILKDGKLAYTKNYVCPRNWEKGEYDEERVRKTVEAQNSEIEDYNRLVRAWNAERARKSDEKGFWKHLLEKSRERLPELDV
ncbi:Uncharacterised protein [uncultured archaeon]|nr:Uncharacterised protein [uncultured archaeon]